MMKRKDFISNVGGGLAAVALPSVLMASGDHDWLKKLFGGGRSERPNIFIYVADDQYMSSMGSYGADPSYTPNLDKFAEEGLRFTKCYTPSSICTPNRGVLLSGMYPLKNGAHSNHSGFFDGVKSLPNYMKEIGYRAVISGKDGIQKPSDLYEWEFRIDKSKQHVPGADEPRHDRHRLSDLAAIEAFVNSDDDRPFCHFHAASLPHGPYLNESLEGLSGYDASNYYMDYEFGQMMEILERSGKRDNTIVIYVNDNEARLPRTKYTLYETGTNVPMIINWPGHTKPGTITSAMVSFIDILPTLLTIAGGSVPEVIDGTSLVDVLEGKTDHHYDETYFSCTGVIVGINGRQEIPYPIRAIRTSKYRYIRYLNHTIVHPKGRGLSFPPEELFDMENDPGEQTNLATDPAFDAVRDELSRKVDIWMEAMGDKGIESELATLKKYPAKK